MKLSYRQIALVFGCSILAIIVCSIVFFRSVQNLNKDFLWVNHTNETILATEETFNALISAETNVRGFLLTQDNDFLLSFEGYHKNVLDGIRKISELTRDNPSQQAHIAQLSKVINTRFILLYKALNSKGNEIKEISIQAQKITEQARSLFGKIEKEEKILIKKRKSALGDTQLFIFQAIPIIGTVILLIICLLFFFVFLENRKRRKTENDLVEKEKIIEEIQEFEFLADAVPQIIWTAKANGNIDYYNKHWHEYTGLSFEQTKDWKWKSVIHPDDLDKCVGVWNHSIETGEIYETETRFKNAVSGEYRWHLERAVPMRNGHGEIIKWLGTGTDIHEKKIEEEQLKLTHVNLTRLHDAILQASNYSIISTNMEGIITTFNKASEEQLGYTAWEVVGKHRPSLFHDPEEMRARTEELSKELGIPLKPGIEVVEAKAKLGIRNEAEWTHVRKDGSHYPARLSITPLKDDLGTILGYMGIAIDISNEKRIKKLAREKENQLKAFIQHTPVAIAMFDDELRFITVSDLYLKEFGKSKRELIGKKNEDEFLQNALKDKLFRSLKGEIIQETDSQLYLNPEKGEQWYHTEIHPWYKYDGRIGGVILMFQNITPRVSALQELRKKSQMLTAFMQNMPVRMYRFDQHGNILEALGRGWKDLGTLPENLIGKNIYELYPDRKKLIDAALKNPDTYELSVNYDVNGNEKYFENYIFKDDESNSEGIIGVALDVTDRKIREKEIQENEERFRSLLESAPDAVIIINEKEEIELVNTQTKKMFGFEEQELIGLPIGQLLPKRFIEDFTSDLRVKGSSSESNYIGITTELNAKRKNGSEFPAEISLSPLQTKKGLLISVAIRDATERKLFQKQLEEAKVTAENANLFKSRFLANMSHEIRTPLNAIIGFADVLSKQKTSEEQQREYLGHINSSGNLLLKLIGDILDISKIEEGKLELVYESFNFKEVIASAIMPYKHSANEKSLEFELQFDPTLPDYVIGDANRIKQVIINLIGNAIKFTDTGKVVVSISNISERPQKEKVALKISVSDTGLGVRPEHHSSIFESFTQADNSIGRKFGGTGLGLSIVKHMVGLMGGEIQITSPYNTDDRAGGPGASFWFTIQLEIDDTKLPSSQAPKDDNRLKFDQSVKVLVVEDNTLNQRLAKLILQNLGCEVHFANNGKEAVESLLQEEFSLVLMDVQMPVMDGYVATKMIRKELNLSLPIIGLTANVFKEDIDNCLASGMNDYLGKPYNENQMQVILRKWLE